MAEEIELLSKNEVERLAIANTLLDSVAKNTDLKLVSKILNECIEKITDCVEIIRRTCI